ncbi:hypothetical protein AAG906_010161 [Vitis piasezkii]
MSIMAEVVEVLADAEMSGSDHPKKSLKRANFSGGRSSDSGGQEGANRGSEGGNGGLFRYFEEVMGKREASVVEACGEIYEKVKVRDNGGGVTLATVKKKCLVGQRLAYGVPNADADVLEDETSCLWCWEVIFSESFHFFSVLILFLIVFNLRHFF